MLRSSKLIARLTPASYEAKRAFNDVAARIVDTPDMSVFDHATRFMVINPLLQGQTYTQVVESQRRLDKNTEAGETGARETGAESKAEYGEPAMLPPDPLRFEGYYELLWVTSPSIPLLG